MSAAELLLIVVVALFVFGPSKLPMLAHHLAVFYRQLTSYQQRLSHFFQSQLNEHSLQENLQKAKKADSQYQSESDLSDNK